VCGIVGILGREPVAGRLVDSLKRLEYRGYVSAGLATLEGGKLERRRAEGKLKNLEALLHNKPLNGFTGIGHTRWATHGKPTVNNAHPHATDRVAVVHNGIIENFHQLRAALQKRGTVFATETDTEIVVHLVDELLSQGWTPIDAVRETLGKLKGAFALGFVFGGQDDLMIGARSGPPLAVGHGKGEMYLGSDAIALGPFTDNISYLDDGDWVVLTHEGATVYDRDNAVVRREVVKHASTTSLVDKHNYRHFMAKEIHEQPEVVGHTLARYVDMATERVALPASLPFDFKDIQRISITACGTASYAGYVAKYWFERFARVPVEIDVASEFRYRGAPVRKGDLAIFISQSGETADTLAALRYAKAQGTHTLSVVNVPTSTIARESEIVMPTLAGAEIGVASTKAFTCQLVVLAALSIAAGRARGELSEEDEAKLVHGLVEVPSRSKSSRARSPSPPTCYILAAAPRSRWLSRARLS
jgi:glucosamine--fructose-6-phosphate aminotransferase (isomerizing)